MLRATKLFSVFLFVAMAFASSSQLRADTYEYGPFIVIGMGQTQSEAIDNAYDEAWSIVDSIEANLPSGHSVVDIVVENSLWTRPMYTLEFSVVIEYSPNGGGGGSGTGGPGA